MSGARAATAPATALPASPGLRGEGAALATLRRLRQHRGAICGAITLATLVLLALAAPLISPYDPLQVSTADRAQAPSTAHLLGTDSLGRDILSRVFHGARISLWLGLISVVIGAGWGIVLGTISGYYGRWVDLALMRLMDVMLAFPRILLALTIVYVLGPTLTNVMLAVGIASIPEYTRVVRGAVLAARQHVYVEAARVVGCPDRVIMFRHILPNVVAPAIVLATLGVAYAILSAAGLSFLGMGAQPPTPEWGAMLSDGRSFLRQAWWISTFPGVAITLAVLGVNLLGDGLRDALDVRLKGS